MQTIEKITRRFSTTPNLFLAMGEESIKLEIKPYLQPFERGLAFRELRALLDDKTNIAEEHGCYVIKTTKSADVFRSRLTYWQRVGRILLEPTIQKLLEFTQSGTNSVLEKRELHNTRRLRYGPHDLHEYRGKFFPQLVKSLINVSRIPAQSLVLDPMCGSGTTTCEAVTSGMSAIGADLNPLSVLIASVKSRIALEDAATFLKKITSLLKKLTFKKKDPKNVWSTEDVSYLERWFNGLAMLDLAAILCDIRKVDAPLYQDFLLVCLSNVIRSVSWQKAADLRVRKEIRPYESGTAIHRFKDEVSRQLDKIYPYLCLKPKLLSPPMLRIKLGNAVKIATVFPEYRGKVNLLITSPPYATALPYLDTDRLSLVVLGLLPWEKHGAVETEMIGTREVTERQRSEAWDSYLARRKDLPKKVSLLIEKIAKINHGDNVGFRRRNLPALLGRYFLNMLDAMRSAHELMSAKAHGYYVVGNNSTILGGEKIEIPTDKLLFEVGATAGWTPKEMIPMELLASRDIFKGNRGSAEAILCFTA